MRLIPILSCAVAAAIGALAAYSIGHPISLPPGEAPDCAAVASNARAAAFAIGAPPPTIGVSGTGVILVFRDSHLLLSSSSRDWSIAQGLGGREIGECLHGGETRHVWSVPGLPPGFGAGGAQ